MTTPTCATCRHFRGHADAECYRFPATIRVFPTHVCGEHAPAEPVGVPQLPEGWVISTADHCTTARQDRIGVYCEAIGSERTVISTVGYIPSEVVIAVIAAHRARGGR